MLAFVHVDLAAERHVSFDVRAVLASLERQVSFGVRAVLASLERQVSIAVCSTVYFGIAVLASLAAEPERHVTKPETHLAKPEAAALAVFAMLAFVHVDLAAERHV